MKKVLFLTLLVLVVSLFAGPTIRVLVWDDALTRAVLEKLPEFEKATGIRVEMELVPSGNVLQKIAVGVSSNSTQYDIVAVDEPYVPQIGKLLEPYDKWPKGKYYEKPDLNVILEETFKAAVLRDVIVGLPINGNVYVWMTRKDIIEKYKDEFMKEYGYEMMVPQTFEALLDMAKFLKKKGIYGFAPFTKSTEGSTCEAMMMFEAYGTTPIMFDKETGKYRVVLNKERAKKAMEMYKELLKYAPEGANNYGHSERIAAFNQGKVFSMFQWPAIIPDHENPDKSMVVGNIIYSAPPSGDIRRAAVRGAWVLGIPKASKNKEAAAEFAYWWSSYKAGKELVKVGMTPARVDLLKDPELAKDRPWFEGIFESMKYAISRPRIENYPEVSNVIRTYWLAGVTGQMSIDEALDKMVEELKNVVEK
ncbi:carbohydrate ABC transporter substrate-binding protein [Thermosipho africanus Ob7]|uniref:extracellular solute-binding protein n=1 Tax=Thermosipho africanus TaxID=2421 RepID=UPI000E0C5B2A|nr:extracellular solute-binding protein [Thermosipho africanus]RDI90884.1 carbohydrate ABC transporter substrate-binding protein [Thermosipho africanus Ob7]